MNTDKELNENYKLFRSQAGGVFDPYDFSDIKEGQYKKCFRIGKMASTAAEYAMLIDKPEWTDWYVRSARYKLQGLEWYEDEFGVTKPVQYEDALRSAVLALNTAAIDETIEEVKQMPDEIYERGAVHKKAVRDTIRCIVALLDDADDEEISAALTQAMDMFEYVCDQNGFDLMGPDHAERFAATFEFIGGILADRDGIDVQSLPTDTLEEIDTSIGGRKRIESAILPFVSNVSVHCTRPNCILCNSLKRGGGKNLRAIAKRKSKSRSTSSQMVDRYSILINGGSRGSPSSTV